MPGTAAKATLPIGATPMQPKSGPHRRPLRKHRATPTKAAPTPSPTTSAPSSVISGSYVQPGTQGYKGPISDLTVYSSANGKVPSKAGCSWTQYKYLDCSNNSLVLSHVYIMGGLYWRGCGNLTINDSIIDWQPSQSWFLIQNACQSPDSGSTITVTHSTLETGSAAPSYTGGSDIGGISEYTGDVPMLVSNSLIQGFPQGLDPTQGSIIKDNEIYARAAICTSGSTGAASSCHADGLFSQGGNDITYEGNYISVPPGATSVIFFQSDPDSSGNRVIGNFLKGGSYTFYNESSVGVVVEGNTFGGATFGDATDCGGGACGTVSIWTGNVHINGSTVRAP
jgi:hypothetical protein